jgi:DNA-binding NarL/FixJ family response regulator
MSPRPARILIVEDQTLVRELLQDYLQQQPNFLVVGACADGPQGIDAAIKLRPDVVLLDLVLPGMHGLVVLHRLRKELPAARVVLLTAQDKAIPLQDAINGGIDAVVVKGRPLRELQQAIEQVIRGGKFFCLQAAFEPSKLGRRRAAPLDLSTREREIVELVASSLSSKEIGSRLNLSVRTVDNHRRNIMNKIGVHDVASLTKWAIQEGIIHLEG